MASSNKRLQCNANSKRGVWLVKVPKYLSEEWERRGGCEVGRVQVVDEGATHIVFRSDPSTSNVNIPRSASSPASLYQKGFGGISGGLLAPVALGRPKETKELPKEHRFVIGDLGQQTIAVFSEDKSGLENPDEESGRLVLEGRVVKRAELRPPKTAAYMRMKIQHISDSSQTSNPIKQIERAAVKYKPIANHAEIKAREKQKKEGKNVRMDKDRLSELLFSAFEKHQFYKLVDLAKITAQPPSYVKELMNEIGNYNTAPPHKYMWELKSEYRHYAANEAGGSKMDTS